MSAANARRYIIRAGDSFVNGDFSKAFDLYTRALSISPELKTIYQAQFQVVFLQLVDHLEQREENDALFDTYRRALSIFPDHEDIINDIGRFLLKKGFYLEAWSQFQKALAQKPESVIAEFQMNVIKARLLHRWHYRMLNDRLRNTLYRVAIQESVEPGDRVLDLGTGIGLLAMYAAQCSPLSTMGIEMNSTLSEIAEHVVRENNFKAITIINKSSYNVTDTDVGGRQDLLIMELFDAGLFGEGVLPTLHNAWANLLHSKSRVLPNRAEFFVRGIQCHSLMTRYYLTEYARKLLNIPSTQVLTSNDSYDCSDINRFKELTYVTKSQSVLQVNFNNAKDLETKLSRVEEYSVALNPAMDGIVDTIIGWFTLNLTDKTSLTTDPTSEHSAKAWQQAVFSNFIPKPVKENNPFIVNFQLRNGKKLDLVPDVHCAKISEITMRFLNDKEYIDMIMSCVDTAFAYLQHIAEVPMVAVADLSPFPLFGLMLMKRGIKMLYCQGETKEDCLFFKKVFDANGINKEQYKILDGDEDSLGAEKFHAIFFNIFDVSGDIDRLKLKKTHAMKVDNLMEGGLFMPYCISVMGQLINSPYLDMCNRVYDENTEFSMAHHINKFQLSANYGIDYTNLEFSELSDPVGLGVCGGMKSGIVECPVKNDGCANALLCWYDIEVLQNCDCITTRRSNSFMDAIAFLANPEVPLVAGSAADIICCVDEDQTFKFIIDVGNDEETTLNS